MKKTMFITVYVLHNPMIFAVIFKHTICLEHLILNYKVEAEEES